MPTGEGQKKNISFSFEGTLFFLVAESIVNSLEVRCKGADIVIINVSHAQVIDITGIVTLGKIKDTLAQQGVRTIFTGLGEPGYRKMLSLGIIDGSERAINRGNKSEALLYAQALAHDDEATAKLVMYEHDVREDEHLIAEITEEGFLLDEDSCRKW